MHTHEELSQKMASPPGPLGGTQATPPSGKNRRPVRLRSPLCRGQAGRAAGGVDVTHHPKQNKSVPFGSIPCLFAPPTPCASTSSCGLPRPLTSSGADQQAFMEGFLGP